MLHSGRRYCRAGTITFFLQGGGGGVLLSELHGRLILVAFRLVDVIAMCIFFLQYSKDNVHNLYEKPDYIFMPECTRIYKKVLVIVTTCMYSVCFY